MAAGCAAKTLCPAAIDEHPRPPADCNQRIPQARGNFTDTRHIPGMSSLSGYHIDAAPIEVTP
jgi:hypothetical protein